MTDPEPQVEKLPNGLTVLLRPVHTAPLVSVWCWYHVGSKNDGGGTTGASHWVEHMNFKGTRSISREQIKVWIERAGGTWNGYTWIDQTTYFETLASDALDLALRIEAERMTDCVYEPEEVESERTVIISELLGNENHPEYLLDVEVTAAALRAHPYRCPTIGWQTDLEAMSRDDLLAHYRRHYVPANATLVIVGDFRPEDAMRSVRERFAAIPAAPKPQPIERAEPPQSGERRVSVERPGTTRYLQVAFRAPAFSDDDFVPCLVADAVLAGGKGVNLWAGGFGRNARVTSPLYQSLVEAEYVSVVSTALLPTEEPYLYSVSATVRDGVAEADIERALFEALARVADSPPGPRELEKAKNQLLTALAFEQEGVTQIAHQLGFFSTIAGGELYARLPESIAAVTAEQVRDAAVRRWIPQLRTVGWFRPAAVA